MTRSCAVLSNCKSVSYDTFRLGWNTFSRLLNISYVNCFKCEHCGPEPDIVICDGTFLGMRKDLIQPFMQKQIHTEMTPIRGTKPKDRIVVKSAQTRKLLQLYSGKSVSKSLRGFRKVSQDKEMTRSQMKDFLFNLGQESPELYNLVKRLTSETKSRMAPREYQDLFYELSLSSPAVGILQIGDDSKAKHLIKKICDHSLNLFDSLELENLKYLKDRTPWLCRFLSNIKDSHGNIPEDVTKLLNVFLEKIDNCFSVDGDNLYPPVSNDKLSFFPNLSLHHGNGIYEADKNSNSDDTKGCRKESYKHPKLTPGIFTVFCPHGICYGFQAMTSCESPKVPFMIFKTRFSKAPSVIIYDNACNLHKYCLNREPVFFKGTRFYVDSFHWKGHIGCSESYCIDLIRSSLDTVHINSQINEQANAGLKRIQSQLTYMSADNFMFHIALFLALKNSDKQTITTAAIEGQLNETFQSLLL